MKKQRLKINLQKGAVHATKDGTLVLLRYPSKNHSISLMNFINELVDEHAPIGANEKVNRKEEDEYIKKSIKEIKEKRALIF
ncbi:hypothetical protein M1585_04795 [Candidatus Parvarchaeota archaeon]|jgi:hypothetical protein|nr:hypothetical protein [Candidatus Parvarchaeota archaeon]